ncbi:MAG: FumA C-terminus/TtdB family hydratase beta subunit [Erysipelotrichaceae bacterium]|nr:FumA C-terminus/TtdB family hydratase beta subunit [Erysipelotrichaceae bacterium]MDY5252075.1 FumA C-terminus/TtdB family hydratase beta subunit [Erysipelotrichaceae bacterium]
MRLDINKDQHLFASLKVGELVYLNGEVYTARDAAHKRLLTMIEQNEPLPFTLNGNGIYYVGPTPSTPSQIYGSAGPTTSTRMDAYTPILLDKGLKFMIGKGRRSEEVKAAIKRNKAVYFVAAGGAGALYASCVKKVEPVAFAELLSEAINKITIEDFPVFVGIDTCGNDIYEEE